MFHTMNLLPQVSITVTNQTHTTTHKYDLETINSAVTFSTALHKTPCGQRQQKYA